jgi:hypothetical protein
MFNTMRECIPECPEFKIDLFKSELIKFHRESGLSLEDFDKIVKYIEIKYNSTGTKYAPTNTPENLALAFNEWYYKFQQYSFGVSLEYHEDILEQWHKMFVENVVNQIYTELCNNIINKNF